MKAPQFTLLLTLLLFLGGGLAFPYCSDDDTQIEESCNVLARRGDGGLTWATLDIYRVLAFFNSFTCDGELAGVRCLAGEGYTAYRYNVWECQEDCTPSV